MQLKPNFLNKILCTNSILRVINFSFSCLVYLYNKCKYLNLGFILVFHSRFFFKLFLLYSYFINLFIIRFYSSILAIMIWYFISIYYYFSQVQLFFHVPSFLYSRVYFKIILIKVDDIGALLIFLLLFKI